MTWTTNDIPSLRGKLAVVTGANSGIGWHTALELCRAGAEVILTARSPEKALDAALRIKAELPFAALQLELMDLDDLTSVKDCAQRVVERYGCVDLLVNNAGVMA